MPVCHQCGPTETRTRVYQGKAFNSKNTYPRELTQCTKCGQVVSAYTPTPEEIKAGMARFRAEKLARMAQSDYVPPSEPAAKHRLGKGSRRGSTVRGVAE